VNEIQLADVCVINPNVTNKLTPDMLCSFVPMECVDEIQGSITHSYVRSVNEVSKGYTYFTDGDVLFAKITPCMENGKCTIANNLKNGIGFGSTEFHVIRAGKDTLPKWVFYFLRQDHIRKSLQRRMTGSAGQQRVPKEAIAELLLPLPPLSEQKRMVAVLEKADRLRRLRRYALELSDTFLQSVFLDMFGDPVTNPKGWDKAFIGEVGEIQGGLQVSTQRNKYTLKAPYLRVANVYRDRLELSEVKIIGLTENEYQRVRLEQGDILIIEGHGNSAEIGRCAIWNGSIGRCVHQNHLIRFRPNQDLVLSEFVSRYINSHTGRKYFQEASNTTSGLNTISTSVVAECPIPIPPITVQRKYQTVVHAYKQIHIQQNESLRQAEHLFQCLLHESFSLG